MKTIDVLVLGHDGPILNAYLSTLAAYGMCPARMIRIVRVRDATLEPPMFRWLFGSLRTEAMSRYQLATTNHWPRWLWKNERRLAESVLDTTAASLDLPGECVRNITTAMKPEDFVIRTDIVSAPNINDPAVVEAVAAAPQEWVLTTGGGIIRAPLLRLEGKQFLHIHPGHLPQIRGADGLRTIHRAKRFGDVEWRLVNGKRCRWRTVRGEHNPAHRRSNDVWRASGGVSGKP